VVDDNAVNRDMLSRRLAQQGYEPLSANSGDFAKHVRDGLLKWAAVVKERNIKVDP
jgi:CheY-like chemotaxis protein